MDLKIPRSEARNIDHSWTLVYGRRKTGKTYMLKNFVKWDHYFLAGKEGIIWAEGTPVKRFSNINDFIDYLIGSLNAGKKVIVDEFQRLPFSVFERVATAHPAGQLILSGSSMAVVNKVFDAKSPLLGFLKESRIGLIRPYDIVKKMNPGIMVDYSPYLRDPWLIPIMKGQDIIKDLHEVISGVRYTIPALLGEIFHEEDRNISEIFEGILGAIGSGTGKPSQIASILYHRGIISRDAASQVAPYIKNLMDMDILKKIRIYKMKRTVYRMASPIFSVYYYMNDKYGLERGLPHYSVVKDNLKRAHSFAVEDFIVEALADAFKGEVRYLFEPEIDGIIVDRRERPLAVIEVKWGRVTSKDIGMFIEKTEDLGIGGRRIIVTKKAIKDDKVEILDSRKLKQTILRSSI